VTQLNGHRPAPGATPVQPRRVRRVVDVQVRRLVRAYSGARRRSRLVPRYERAVAGLTLAWLLTTAGAWVTFGLGWALLLAGAELAAYFLLPYDVDRPLPPPPVNRPDLPEPVRRWMSLPDDEEEEARL
jgi:hypothetical protein